MCAKMVASCSAATETLRGLLGEQQACPVPGTQVCAAVAAAG